MNTKACNRTIRIWKIAQTVPEIEISTGEVATGSRLVTDAANKLNAMVAAAENARKMAGMRGTTPGM